MTGREPTQQMVDALLEALPIGAYEEDEMEGMVTACTEALRAIASPDLAVAFVANHGFRGDFTGLDGFRASWLDWLEGFSTYETTVEATRLGPGVAVVLTRQTVTPRGGETTIEAPAAAAAWWDGDRVVRLEFHLDRALALRTAGLPLE